MEVERNHWDRQVDNPHFFSSPTSSMIPIRHLAKLRIAK